MFVVPIIHQPGAALFHDFRHPEGTSDFHQLPLETMTSLSFARAERQSMVAAALLLTTMAASAPVILVRIFFHMVMA